MEYRISHIHKPFLISNSLSKTIRKMKYRI